jgi:predicted DNA-binding transcriptional regulator AlpA
MKEFEFTLKFALADTSIDASDYIESLGNAGCDDALIGVRQKGRIALEFCRVANNATDAVISALKDVKSVIPDAKLIEATPDLVGISDIAAIIGVTRQNIRKVMQNNFGSFPSPIHEGKSSIWHLSSVLNWFNQGERRKVEPTLVEIANANMQLNIAKESTYSDPEIQSKIYSALA